MRKEVNEIQFDTFFIFIFVFICNALRISFSFTCNLRVALGVPEKPKLFGIKPNLSPMDSTFICMRTGWGCALDLKSCSVTGN